MWIGSDVAWEDTIILGEDFYFSQLEFYIFCENGVVVIIVKIHYVMEVLEAVCFVSDFVWHYIEEIWYYIRYAALGNLWRVFDIYL